jgi:hypothetical protein
MLDHPFRTLGTLFSLLFTAGFAWAVTLGGYSLDDPEIENERAWVQGFKYDQPEAARQAGHECKHEIGRSPWTRDGAMALFRCIRAKGEAAGYYYE